jgi:short-subunit dehydrogenase
VDLKGPDASSFGSASSRVRFWELDITQTEDITKVVEEVVLWTKETGSQLGGVINCAGAGTAAKVGQMFVHYSGFAN